MNKDDTDMKRWQPAEPIAVGETMVIDGVPRVCGDAGPVAASTLLTPEEIDAIKARNAALPAWPWAEAGAAETYAEQTRRDIPRLLATLDARDAEIRRLRNDLAEMAITVIEQRCPKQVIRY